MTEIASVQPCLESARIRLRPYTLCDAKDVALLAGDYRVAKETMNIPHPYNADEAEAWISSLDTAWCNRERAEYAIILKKDDQYIGGISFFDINGDEAEIGYWIGVPYWNKGYCTEAGQRLVQFGRSALSLRKITAMHLASNPKSGKVLKNIGLDWRESGYRKDRDGKRVRYEFYAWSNNQ